MATNITLPGADIVIDYTNWKGKRRKRLIRPIKLEYLSEDTEFHKGNQWFCHAYDWEKKALRTFAMSDIHRWVDLSPGREESKGDNGKAKDASEPPVDPNWSERG